jgi:hypothetical protein
VRINSHVHQHAHSPTPRADSTAHMYTSFRCFCNTLTQESRPQSITLKSGTLKKGGVMSTSTMSFELRTAGGPGRSASLQHIPVGPRGSGERPAPLAIGGGVVAGHGARAPPRAAPAAAPTHGSNVRAVATTGEAKPAYSSRNGAGERHWASKDLYANMARAERPTCLLIAAHNSCLTEEKEIAFRNTLK